ncbi:protein GOS9-like [Rutidosis leptorrhynchoides]|uniref:protein GOS9-like n=1 Tax=Rutidosis leptorrhynchoides TaxID=125765 RepID=UPI003A99A376
MASSNVIKVATWGGNGGDNEWTFFPDEGPAPYWIKEITVTSTTDQRSVIALTFIYEDADKHIHISKVGGQTRGYDIKYNFSKGRKIVEIKGEYGDYSNITVITSLAFGTQLQPSGGTPFSLSLTEGRIVGFYGKYGNYLDSIGAILSPDYI